MSAKPSLLQHDCTKPGCKWKADCTPVLIVPAHPMSRNKSYSGVRSVLWCPLCNAHFSAATVNEFLNEGVIKGMQESINFDFEQNGAVADWKRAKFEKLGRFTKEFLHYEKIYLGVRDGMPADIAVDAAGKKPN